MSEQATTQPWAIDAVAPEPTGQPAYVTTPIYYVNASPHLGHAYTTIVADVLNRFHRLNGRDAFFLTGTDEHGTNIARAAEAAGIDPQEFTDRNSQKFRDLLPVLHCEPSYFIRTTDDRHEAFVQEVLTRLHEQGDIYEATYSGPYCEPCEAYYRPEELLEGDLCPTHKRPVTTLEETNWFFRLSKYQDQLAEYYEQHPEFVWPRSRYNEALSFIRGGLEDFSISRSTISWGVPVPWDTDQVTYVWVDALFNYLSALGFGRDEDVTDIYWPPDTQLLAKDILRFHAVSWPALLMALGMELPRQLVIHGYLLVRGDKMSKTTGNVFDPFELIDAYGVDPLRFYLLREVQFGQDGSVGMESFQQRYTTELANDLGNLVSRTAAMCGKYLDGAAIPTAPGIADSPIAERLESARKAWSDSIEELDMSGALETVWEVVRALNRHVEERAPWQLAKVEESRGLLADTMAELSEGLIGVARMLWPFMPETSVKVAAAFGVAPGDLAAHEWGDAAGNTAAKPAPLFPRSDG